MKSKEYFDKLKELGVPDITLSKAMKGDKSTLVFILGYLGDSLTTSGSLRKGLRPGNNTHPYYNEIMEETFKRWKPPQVKSPSEKKPSTI